MPRATSQSRTLPSSPTVASIEPSGEKAASLAVAASALEHAAAGPARGVPEVDRRRPARRRPGSSRRARRPGRCGPAGRAGPMIRCSSSPVRGSQIRTLPLCAEAIRRPSGANASGADPAGAVAERHLGVGRRGRPELDRPIQAARGGQRRRRARRPRSGRTRCGRGTWRSRRRRRSQRRTLLSSLPETSWRPSGEKARPRTNPRWPIRVSSEPAGLAVPEPDGLVPAAGGHAAAVRAEGDGIDEVDVPAQSVGDRAAAGSERSQRSTTSRLASASWRPSGANATASTPPGPPAIGGPSSPPVRASRSRA